ncbi:hypothetical protein chiPu_0029340, partial [Chiloscyllium punctatum]|nr:hypothetical protein [Chiloscyllium punctatum]
MVTSRRRDRVRDRDRWRTPGTTRTLSAATFLSPRCPPPISPSSPSRNSGNLLRKLGVAEIEPNWRSTAGALLEESTGRPTLLARRLGSMRMSECESGTSWGHS